MSVNSDIVYFHSSLPPIHLSSSSSSLLIFPLPSPPLLFLLTCSPSSLLLFHSSYICVKAIRWFLRRENFLFSPDEKEITKWKDQTIKEMIKKWKNKFLFSSNAEMKCFFVRCVLLREFLRENASILTLHTRNMSQICEKCFFREMQVLTKLISDCFVANLCFIYFLFWRQFWGVNMKSHKNTLIVSGCIH